MAERVVNWWLRDANVSTGKASWVTHYLTIPREAGSKAAKHEGRICAPTTANWPSPARTISSGVSPDVGQAWKNGGYPGSLDRSEATLERSMCEENGNAWLLTGVKGRRAISAKLPASFGVPFPNM